jgi:hypothetical protein
MSVSLEHKQRMLAHLEHPMSKKITIGENETAIFTLPNGVKLSVSIDDGDSQLRAAIDFERDCGNEGWIEAKILPPIKPAQLRKFA